MTESDPFAGLGEALARLRQRAGFLTQTEASEVLRIDKGQLSRWENENPRPTLENLGRLLAGYGATVDDLAVALDPSKIILGDEVTVRTRHSATPELPEGRRPGIMDEDLIRALTEALRRIEGRQVETESRLERLEKELGRGAG